MALGRYLLQLNFQFVQSQMQILINVTYLLILLKNNYKFEDILKIIYIIGILCSVFNIIRTSIKL